MKIALCALAVIGCALTGRALASGASRRAKVLQEWMDALMQLRIGMLERHLPVGAALAQSRYAPFRQMGERLGSAGVFAAWTDVSGPLTRHGGNMDCMTGEDLGALNRLFSSMGAGGKSEQEVLFQSALKELGRLEDAARHGGAERLRLYTTLGALCGLAVVVGFL